MVAPVLPNAVLLMKDSNCVQDVGRERLSRLLYRLEFDAGNRELIVVSNVLEADEFGLCI